MPVINRIADFHEDMIAWRHALHRHPEICYEEEWTSDFVAKQLTEFGIEIHRGLAKTGVVGVLHGRSDTGRAIGLRADMDGLPMDEETISDYKSESEGRMHACGHDGHMAMLLGAARYLSETRHFDGTVYFIFQPAEEGGAGARKMMDEGLFNQFPMDTVWGMHNWPGLPTGNIAVSTQTCMASADLFTVSITGQGGHAAMPHQAHDPILAAAHIITGLQAVISRQTNPLDSAVLSVTMMHGGSALNVIPDYVTLGGTARAIDPKTRKAVKDSLHHILSSLAAAYNCQVKIDWQVGYPPTINHRECSMRAAEIARLIAGQAHVHMDLPPSMGAEDFAFMLEDKPGAYIWLGAGDAVPGKMLHNSQYDFNDDILPIGTSYWARLAESELKL